MDNLTFCAPTLLGVEGICANELKYNGFKNVRAENGRVLFDGGLNDLAAANLNSRYAERIQILVTEFTAYTFDELFEGVRSVEWERFISRDDAFPVKGSCLSSQLCSVSDCQKIIKKAVVERLSPKYGVSWFAESGAVHQIQFLILNNRVSVTLDTTGAGLHKRGYRAVSNDAPIKETLAASLVDLARVRSNHLVVDPMCGSGTILIEAALKALRIPAGLNRSFAAEQWPQIPAEIWRSERQRAAALKNTDCAFRAVGYDIDADTLEIARANAEKAGVADRITFVRRDIRDFEFDGDYETVITNPPYGERLLDIEQAEELYAIMGKKFVRETGKSYTIICPDDDFEKVFRRRADKRRKLYNGTLKCQVYMFFK